MLSSFVKYPFILNLYKDFENSQYKLVKFVVNTQKLLEKIEKINSLGKEKFIIGLKVDDKKKKIYLMVPKFNKETMNFDYQKMEELSLNKDIIKNIIIIPYSSIFSIKDGLQTELINSNHNMWIEYIDVPKIEEYYYPQKENKQKSKFRFVKEIYFNKKFIENSLKTLNQKNVLYSQILFPIVYRTQSQKSLTRVRKIIATELF
jgi:hypothetical protein